MPIVHKRKGNLISLAKEGQHRYVVQGNNCFAIQGSGLAPQMCKAFKGLYEADRDYYIPVGADRLGHINSVLHKCENRKVVRVFNMYTQYRGNSPEGYPIVSYEGLFEAFKKLDELVMENVHEGVANTVLIPYIGAGLAKGNWEMIEALINKATPHCVITLVEYSNE